MRYSSRSLERLAGVGNLARTVTSLFALAFLAGLISSLAIGAVDVRLGVVLTALVLTVAVRSWFISVRVTAQEVIATTWMRKLRIPLDSIATCQSMPYAGFFSKGSTTHLLWELELSTTDYRVYRLGGTVAFKSKSIRQQADLTSAIALARKISA